MAITASMRWRRLDLPGHDTCRLDRGEEGWTLSGVAVFEQAAGAANIAYDVRCDHTWRTRSGRVRGTMGTAAIDLVVVREGTAWTLNGTRVPGLDHLDDLDLSFTPATNLTQLRRVAMDVGATVHLPVAWLNLEKGTLTELAQIYERRSERTYWYKAPGVGYAGLLELAENGFVRRYPSLWEAEPAP